MRNPSIIQKLYTIVSLLLLCSIMLPAQSDVEANELVRLQDEYHIKKLYILEDAECKIDPKSDLSMVQDERFVHFDGDRELASRSCFWLHFRLRAASGFGHYFKDWKLSIGEADFAEVIIADDAGNVLQRKKFGRWYPKSKKETDLNFKRQRVNLSFDLSEELHFYIRYQKKDKHKHVMDVKLMKYDFYQSTSYLLAAWQDWLFLGFILTMILINFLFYYGTKYKAYLFHGFFILGFFIFILDLYGVALNLPVIREYPYLVQLTDMLGIGIADVAYFQFVRHYLNLGQRLSKWDSILSKIVWAKFIFYPLLIVFYYLTFNEPLTDKLLLVFLLMEYSIITYFLVFELKPKERAAMYLIIGSSIILVVLLINTLSLFVSIGVSKSLSQIGMLGEILAFSFGLSYRFRQLKEEEEQAEKIRELSEFKSQLLTNITHEFRTPLTIIQGVSEMFQESIKSRVSPQEIQKGYDAITRNSKSLLNLVNQMLDLAKIESKSLHLDLQSGDLIAIVREVVNGLMNAARKKDISLVLEAQLESLEMDVDTQKIHTILVNLISNAIKFTPQYGTVKVIISAHNGKEAAKARIRISDTGKGIAQEEIQHIFDRFFQSKSENKSNAGTGIGLSLVKEFVDLMKGTIDVESELDTGTTFTIELPITKEVERSRNKREEALSIFTSAEDEQFDLLDQKPVLLIVEDNMDIVDFLERLLKDDYKLVKAFDGQEGLEKATSIIPDLIISDVMMPKMDGIQLCQSLKTNERTNHIPIVILTAKSAFEHKLEGLSTGADAYLTKPFRKEELFVRLKKLNESRALLQQKFSQFSLIEKPGDLKKENSFLHKVHSVIEANLTNPEFNVEELARQMHLSRMQLHRKIKAVSNRSTSNYIRSYRLHKSKPQLVDMAKTISEIAWAVGFQDVNYYGKSFQKEFGVTPSGYREGLKRE
ncbi:MAG: ATP-binding protein [Bacteroidota bacterium]